MRSQQNKLVKGKSTKAERRFMEILKRKQIPFRTKVKINGHEVDFLIGNLAVEIDGHTPNLSKFRLLKQNNYYILQLNNWELKEGNLWLNQILAQYK